MLQVLAELIHSRKTYQRKMNNHLQWAELHDKDLQLAFPFWAAFDIRRVQNSLQNLGLIVIDPSDADDDSESRSSFYAIDEPVGEQGGENADRIEGRGLAQKQKTQTNRNPQGMAGQTASSGSGSASLISPNWQPGQDWIRKCQQHNIPEQFIRALVSEFVGYWRERGQARFSWGNAFYKHALKEWRNEQTRQGAFELASEMSAQWRPSEDAIGILEISGISSSFIEDAVPEFVLYWRERGMVNGAWNTKFIEHIRKQWAKFSASFGYDDTPKAISSDWQPSGDCFEILQLAEIDEHYARSKIPEFVMYWKDSQQVKSSWNTVFLQFIKQDWARQLKQVENADLSHAENQSLVGSSQQKIKERFQRIADRSWAE